MKSQEWIQGEDYTEFISYYSGSSSVTVTLKYTHDTPEDVTRWYTDGDGYTEEIKNWEDEERLILQFFVTHSETKPADIDEVVHCLACLNVNENS